MNIDELIASARKKHNKVELNVLQLIKAEFSKATHNGITLNKQSETKILLKMADQRRDDCKMYLQNGRKDLAEDEKIELSYINQFIPKLPTKEEISAETFKVISNYDRPIMKKDTGNIIKEVRKIYPIAKGQTISDIVTNFIKNTKDGNYSGK